MTQKQALHSGEFNIAMEYGPFLDVFPIEHRISIAMLVYQGVSNL